MRQTWVMFFIIAASGCSNSEELFSTSSPPIGGNGGQGGFSSEGGQGGSSGGQGGATSSSTGGATSSSTGGSGGNACECALPGAVSVCIAGQCYIDHCLNGYDDCNSLAEDGCEIQISNDPDNCGVCTNQCEPTAATATCVAGQCSCETVSSGLCECDDDATADCDDNRENGCEEIIIHNDLHCGSCGHECKNDAYCHSRICRCDAAPTYPYHPNLNIESCLTCLKDSCCDVFTDCLADTACAAVWQAWVDHMTIHSTASSFASGSSDPKWLILRACKTAASGSTCSDCGS